jgi:hypothetical protein
MKSLVLAALVVLSLVALGAQAPSGTISGTVRDPTGAAIPGVSVTATNVNTGKVTTMLTNESGTYTFSSLAAGTYTVNAGLPGFADQRFSNVMVGPSSSLRLDIALPLSRGPSQFDRTAKADIVADSQSRQGVVTMYRGHVQMTTESVIIGADELDFNSQTQRADVRGNVSAQMRQIGPRVIPLARQ